jgi:hypothetical protein
VGAEDGAAPVKIKTDRETRGATFLLFFQIEQIAAGTDSDADFSAIPTS